MHSFPRPQKILVGSRSSALAQAQIKEVLAEILRHHPLIEFEPVLLKTTGDIDRNTSLRVLEKTDFFTDEIELLQLGGGCRISIHAAKDLPLSLKEGLVVAALTKGVDSSDALVLRKEDTLSGLAAGSLIATSSVRREEAVKQLRSDLKFMDLRGTIEERLYLLESGAAAGVVVAEAALIRLGLTHLNRVRLPGSTVPMQGKLAVVACAGDEEMLTLFSMIDA